MMPHGSPITHTKTGRALLASLLAMREYAFPRIVAQVAEYSGKRSETLEYRGFQATKKGPGRCPEPLRCGAKGIRTPDPLHAMEMRYQLRHSPIFNCEKPCGFRGAKGIRTPDPLHAMEMRYQLRHSPVFSSCALEEP